MTTSLADLLLGVDMVGGENFCDSVYNFLKNQGKDINLITNSGFGVWSQSDANKGLGTLVYDNLAGGNFAVGDTITGAVTGATGKLMTDNGATSMTLGACTGRFDDNEQIGNGVGVTANVNMPDGAAGVDLMRNTDHWVGAAVAVPPNGWTVDTAGIFTIFNSGDGAPYDKCLKIEVNAVPTANPFIYQAFTTEIGKIYTFRFYFKHGTATQGNVYLGTVGGGSQYNSWIGLTDAAWTEYSFTFEATTVTTYVSLQTASGVAGQFELYDELSCYEITPCCTAGDNVAFDGWYKDVTLDIYREHWGSNTKDGNFYSLACVNSGAGDELTFNAAAASLEEWYAQFQDRPVTIGAWVLAYKASHCRIRMLDTAGSTYSLYHTGGGDWEWLEVTREIDAAATDILARFQFNVAGDVDGTTIVYISQPMFVFGWSIGEGMYQPRLREVIWSEAEYWLNSFAGSTISADTDINLEAESDARLPKGCKAVYLRLYGINAAASEFMHSAADGAGASEGVWMASQVGTVPVTNSGWQKCNANGDIHVDRATTWTSVYLKILGVQVN